MKKYQVITRLERVKLISDKSMKITQRAQIMIANSKQHEVWRLVVKYFTQANGGWDEAKKTVGTETEYEIYYDAKDYDDAIREVNEIKTKAFRHQGQMAINNIRLKFKKIKTLPDDDPQYEKLVNNLANLGIYLDVDVKEIL